MSNTNQFKNSDDLSSYLNDIRCYLLDMDGTFYLGGKLLPGALEFMQYLGAHDLGYLFLTNNSFKHAGIYARKIRDLGFDVPEERIFTRNRLP